METEKEFKLCVHDSYCTSSGVYVCVCVDQRSFSANFSFVVRRIQSGAIYYKPATRQASFATMDVASHCETVGNRSSDDLLTVVGISVVPMPSLSDAVVDTAALNGL